jgi:ATP-dependent Clp protease ATP-binding subunit ClpA
MMKVVNKPKRYARGPIVYSADEVEKAQSHVINALLQVLDDGRLTDGKAVP